ncbi:MAG TPA: LamG-like jellyroll fold domain-containing protein [Candidatus Acidoferrum sp.]|nr:LamG-like jellyroll fold domain-containing protein [Candidatus Acidoferrum sp.]
MKARIVFPLVLVAMFTVAPAGTAQTLTITNGVQIYASLTNTTVTMSNRCELWVTNSTTPLSGCTINLNSIDAWLFLTGVKPSVVASTYLGQIKINNASAVADSNCRVVQYGQNGAVVIPQPSSFQPLTVFTEAEFMGAATPYGQWTYYTGTGLTNISSFKLKRGYQAVLAQSANGANYSKCYIAQDGDLEIGVLPATLDKQVQFICVTPWRWTSKKGIANNPPLSWLNVNWWYDWNIDQSSSRDLEYVAIKQQPNWPGLSQNWQSLGINTVLGYNEPDNSSQDAYKNLTPQGSVTNAVARLPDQLATGLRVGSPATTDAGRSGWLYPFVQQADAAGYRVDFVAVHYYWAWNPTDPGGAANQMYSFLLDIWNNTHRPIWITEWNNGANWTDNNPYAVPTYAQQQACIAAMTQMLESTPFVERYAFYNWVEDARSLVTSSNTVTPAGTTYSNLVSNISYAQALPDNGTRGMAEFLFATNTWDSSGYYNNGMAVGAPSYTAGHNSQVQAMALDGANSYVQLPANIAAGGAFTFAAWVYWNGGNPWQRIFDFGNDTSHYLFLTPNSGSTTLRFAINNGSGEQIVERSGALASGSWQHVAVTLNGSSAVLYVNGASVATNNSMSIAPSAFSPIRNYLGKSQFPNDPLFHGKLDEVEIADYAMTAAQISARYNSAQCPAYTGGVWTNNASGNWGASNNWNSGLMANGVSYIADFSAIDITGNRTVTLDSARTIGGLRFGDTIGSQTWLLSGTDTLTLDAGGGNAPTIAVNQNTATISTPISGSYGFAKTGNGTLTLNGPSAMGGGLTVNAGAVNISGGATAFGSGTSSVGYLTGSGNLTMTGGTLAMAGELRVGGSDRNGSQYVATGAVAVANATLSVGALTVARGNYLDNSISGTVTLNSGGTLISTNDAILQFAGTGRGKLALNGGNFIVGPTATKWLMVGYYDTGAGELDVTNGNLLLDNGTSLKLCRSGNTGGNMVNQFGGNVTFYSDAGVTIGGGGNLDLNYAGVASSTNTYNLNGGTLTVPSVIVTSSAGNSTFNFNGGTLESAASSTTFMQGLTRVNVRNFGAKIDTAGANVTIGQALLHSGISGDSTTDGGLTKNGAGTLTLGNTNTFTGSTIINAGTLALGSVGSIASSRSISLVGGAVFDVSAVTGGFALGAAQTLSGSGTVNGAMAINGTIAPGTSGGAVGTLTMGNSPVFNGVTLIKINRNNGTPLNDQIVLPSSGMTYGGTLTASNVGAPLTAGDNFQIFSAANYNGTFAALNLPSLGAGLAWNTNALTNGALSVIATVEPQFSGMNQTSDGNFQFAGAGAAGVTYELDAATNLAPPIMWRFVTNGVAGQNGLFDLWDLSATNFPQRFYRITSNQ